MNFTRDYYGITLLVNGQLFYQRTNTLAELYKSPLDYQPSEILRDILGGAWDSL